jgi:hypothetical protein
MMTLGRTRRTDDCLSDLQMDTLLASGEDEGDYGIPAHAAACARCFTRWSDVSRARDAFHASHPRRRADENLPVDGAPSRSGKGRAWLGMGVVGLAAAAALLFAIRRPADPAPAERTKGGSAFGFYIRHGESVVRGADGTVVHPGDLLRFVVHSSKRHLAILSVDGARKVSVYFPDEPRTAPIDAVQEVPLPRSTRLDAVLGRETLHAVFCDGPTDLTEVHEALRANPEMAVAVPNCEVQSLTIEKRP